MSWGETRGGYGNDFEWDERKIIKARLEKFSTNEIIPNTQSIHLKKNLKPYNKTVLRPEGLRRIFVIQIQRWGFLIFFFAVIVRKQQRIYLFKITQVIRFMFIVS